MLRKPVPLSALLACLLLLCAHPAQAQTKLKLSSIIPGTENVQLVANGDFQSQGPPMTNVHPNPIGWSRQADMFADPGTNMVVTDNGVVAKALVISGASVCKYQRIISLEPNTDYVLSAYLWNFGDSLNRMTTVIDMADVNQEPQITLGYSDPNADQGYFVCRSFNTLYTGSTITLRVFCDGLTGAGTSPQYYPVAAQWDNVAITKAADFIPPQAVGSLANLRPTVSISSPADGANLVFSNSPANFQLAAAATDYDGTIAKVEFFAGSTKLGEATNSPYTLLWTIPASGSYQLTAVATDDQGATTVSAFVSLSASVPPPPPTPFSLLITAAGSNSVLYWPTGATALSLLSASNLVAPMNWRLVTNPVVVSSNQNTVTIPSAGARRFFQLGTAVDPSTLDRKLLMGYQGWFACTNDGSPLNKWVHWFSSQIPVASNATVDFWPDVSELDRDELFDTGMTLPDGSPARVYAAWNQKTILRHFKWMKDYNLDGVFLQRFTSELANSNNFAWRNRVTTNVRLGAETYGRVFAIMYDISGQNPTNIVSVLTNDWLFLVNTMQVTNSPNYVRHRGKPVVAIWGFGFSTRTNTPADALATVNFFKAAGCTVMGGVPAYWRTLSNDAQTNSAWTTAYRSFDILSPWTVGRFANITDANNFMTNVILPDLTNTRFYGIDYMPVIFPGFSWHNLNGGLLNQIPRNGGTFYWQQAFNAVAARSTMLYGAMFDEMNEGTSMFKMAPTTNQLPAQGTFVPLDIDHQSLPSDWYLRLADQASRLLRGEISLSNRIPIVP